MANKIQTVYVIHHSHTDIGYTDLQERILTNQAHYIHNALSLMAQPENGDFRWNCETLYCVEEFFKTAAPAEREAFLALARAGKIGLSANYLNYTDLCDREISTQRLKAWVNFLETQGIFLRTAMMADINGISMGYRDVMTENGVEFLYSNVHTHHGMYPLYQNQNAFFWEGKNGKRLLVWNGGHYNLGNLFGIKPNPVPLGMTAGDPVEILHEKLTDYLRSCESQGYAYDFLPLSVSGVFSDNAPPEPEILRTIQAFQQRYGREVTLRMVSLQELYAEIREKLRDAPVYQGDFTDWWANGIGSTPYALKHYRDAQHRYQLCGRLDPQVLAHYPRLCRWAQDNLLFYAEHTWGHSSTITNPYDTMVLNLDMRKNSYASKAHEAASRMLTEISLRKGDTLNYYNTSGAIRVCNPSRVSGLLPVEFYIESCLSFSMEIRDEAGRVIPSQVSDHPRGRRITFTDSFPAGGERVYTYAAQPLLENPYNSRQCYMGVDRVRDIISDYDSESYHLPYGFENDFFRLAWWPHKGITSFVDKQTGRELLGKGEAPFFTPIHQRTPLSRESRKSSCPDYEVRRLLGRNIRGANAVLTAGQLTETVVETRGPVFTQLRLCFALPGTIHADVVVKFYDALPRVDFTLELGKTLSTDIESIFLPLSLNLPDSQVWLRKGSEAFRPGIDQLPGTNMEFYVSDHGLAYTAPEGGALIASPDVPLLYMGDMAHHPIRLCDGHSENNRRPIYSWVMNNNWETNFKMDLSGFCEYRYTLWLTHVQDGEEAMDALREHTFDPYTLITE